MKIDDNEIRKIRNEIKDSIRGLEDYTPHVQPEADDFESNLKALEGIFEWLIRKLEEQS